MTRRGRLAVIVGGAAQRARTPRWQRMASRLLAGGVLLISAIVAWLAISYTIIARLMQAAIAVSMVYVGYLAWHGWRTMRATHRETPSSATAVDPNELPWVTVVIPAHDEAAVIAAVVGDVLAQRYHAAGEPRFDLLVVDDGSGDGTGELARALMTEAPELRVVRRDPGDGPRTKGAALAFSEPFVRGEIVVVLDADARIAPDFVARSMRAWTRDPHAAALQVQRRERNAAMSWLTGAQADEQLMDLASQCGRWATDGTAELRGNGMFVRRAALERAGGWAQHALTEDLDLSTRLVRQGDDVTLAPEAWVGEEAVESVAALWRQRLRWAEGSLRRLMEHGPALVGSRLPVGRKLDFLAFVGEFVIPPLFVTTIAAALVTVALPQPADWTVPVSLFLGYGIGTFVLAIAGLAADGVRGLSLLGRATRGSLFLSHWLLVVPAALVRIAFGAPTVAFAKTARSARLDR
jgi:1,2-diacylglycerol 3-beta-glucosyltransferase